MGNYQNLWDKLRKGHRAALARLFRLFYSDLYNYGMKLVNNSMIVEDGIQDVFLDLWIYRESLQNVDSVDSYLFSSVRRTVIRKAIKSRELEKKQKNIPIHIFEDAINKEKLMILLEVDESRKKQLEDAVKRLTSRQKETLFLVYYEGYSHKEVAAILDINKQSIYNLISTAVKDLQDIIRTE